METVRGDRTIKSVHLKYYSDLPEDIRSAKYELIALLIKYCFEDPELLDWTDGKEIVHLVKGRPDLSKSNMEITKGLPDESVGVVYWTRDEYEETRTDKQILKEMTKIDLKGRLNYGS